MNKQEQDFIKDLHDKGDLIVGKQVFVVDGKNFNRPDLGRGYAIDILVIDLPSKGFEFFETMQWNAIYPNLRTGFKIIITNPY